MVLELDEKEKEVVRFALESFEDELKDERLKTDKKLMREALRHEEDLLKRVLERVS